MVSIIEKRQEAGDAPYVEFRVHAGPEGAPALATWEYLEHAGPRAALGTPEYEMGAPIDEIFRDAIRYAAEHRIPFVWINDPEHLFPPDKRPPLP